MFQQLPYCGGASFSSSSEWCIQLLFTETGTHSVKLCKVVDNPVMAQRTFPLVLCSRPQRFPSCSPLTRCSMSFLCKSSNSGTRRNETVEIPQLQPVFSGPCRSHARCVQRQLLGRCSFAVHRRFYVPVITQRRLLSGSVPGSVFAFGGGHSSCATEKRDSILSIAVYGGGEGLFRRILRHFSRSSGYPGVERQFFELSSAHSCECSRAPGGAGVARSLTLR